MVKTMMEAQNTTPTVLPLGLEINYVTEGERLFEEGRLAEARAMFQAAADECPGNAMAWNNLGVIAMTENQDKEAERYLRRAIEIKSDLLEARFNLAEVYCLREQWDRAVRELLKILTFKPADLPAIKRLAQVYLSMGKPDKAREIIEESENFGAMKAFVDSLWLGIKYYAMADELSGREKLEKFTGAILKFLDGQDGRSRRYKLVSTDPETGRETVLEDFFDAFYYKESPMSDVDEGRGGEDRPELILTIGDHDDWMFFREVLRNEMKAEGGCLGDFTQTRKVLRREPRLAKYSVSETIKYFQDNVGPCDCHVLRAVLV